MPVNIKGAGESYEVSSGRIVAPGTEPPAWFTAQLANQVTDCGGDQKCVALKEKAAQCMAEKGAYALCAELVEAYNICFANALQNRYLPPEKVEKLEKLRQAQLARGEGHYSYQSDAERVAKQLEVVRAKYEQQHASVAEFVAGAAETSQIIFASSNGGESKS
jgi:hypothetical protein